MRVAPDFADAQAAAASINGWLISMTSDDARRAHVQRSRELRARARDREPDYPLHPDWGKVERLMNLAWASLNQAEPDPQAAKRWAEAAL